MREVRPLQQRRGEHFRRWYSSPTADLFAWFADGEPVSFEFCYDKPRRERSVRWTEDAGLRFFRIDDGEHSPLRNRSPVAWPAERVDDAERTHAAQRFEALAATLEPRVYRFVLGRIWLGEPRKPDPEGSGAGEEDA